MAFLKNADMKVLLTKGMFQRHGILMMIMIVYRQFKNIQKKFKVICNSHMK